MYTKCGSTLYLHSTLYRACPPLPIKGLCSQVGKRRSKVKEENQTFLGTFLGELKAEEKMFLERAWER